MSTTNVTTELYNIFLAAGEDHKHRSEGLCSCGHQGLRLRVPAGSGGRSLHPPLRHQAGGQAGQGRHRQDTSGDPNQTQMLLIN